MPRGAGLTVFFAVVLAAFVLGGCSSSGVEREEPMRGTPYDFGIDLAVFAPKGGAGLPDDLKPGVFVLTAGGEVHIRMGTRAIEFGHPPFTGRMSPAQVNQTWTIIQGSGLLDADNPSQVSASSMVEKRFDRSVAALVITADGHRRWFKVALDTPTADAATVRSLIAVLARFGPRP
jgi:hypothetical protein